MKKKSKINKTFSLPVFIIKWIKEKGGSAFVRNMLEKYKHLFKQLQFESNKVYSINLDFNNIDIFNTSAGCRFLRTILIHEYLNELKPTENKENKNEDEVEIDGKKYKIKKEPLQK
jgi:hypothetical protein